MSPTKPALDAQSRQSLRGPAWRSQLADRMAEGRAVSLMPQVDDYVRQACDVYRSRGQGDLDGTSIDPDMRAAIEVHEDFGREDQLKILALGDVPTSTMAERTGLTTGAIEAWEALYFDVRPSRGATSWISGKVIQHELDQGNEALAAKLKLAYCGGPSGALAILDAESRVPLSAGERLFERQVALQVKFEQAAAVPLRTDREKARFLTTYARLQLDRERLRLAEVKLASRCTRALQKHELARLRLQNAAEREQRQFQEKQQKAQRRMDAQRLQAQQQAELREFHQALQLAEQNAAVRRGAASPLAALTWTTSATRNVPSAVLLRDEVMDSQAAQRQGSDAEPLVVQSAREGASHALSIRGAA